MTRSSVRRIVFTAQITCSLAFISITRERYSDLVRTRDIRLHCLFMPVIQLSTLLFAQNPLLAINLSRMAYNNPSPGICLTGLDKIA
jgi:hypothetical protein